MNCVGEAKKMWAVTWSPDGRHAAAAGSYVDGSNEVVNTALVWYVP